MKHKTVTESESELQICPYDCKSAHTCPNFQPYPPEEIIKNDREYRSLLYKIDSYKIDLFALKYFLWHEYQPRKPEYYEEKHWHYREAFKHCPDCENIWFISTKRDLAWKFVPMTESFQAFSKPFIDFISYPLENDLRFVKNKKIIRKILIEEENREDTVFFDIFYDEILRHPREEYNWGGEDFEPYDRFNPITEFDKEAFLHFRCEYCGKPINPRRTTQTCCSSPDCRKKLFIRKRQEKISRDKKIRENEHIKNPVRCLNCDSVLPASKRPNNKFCCSSCRVAYHRKKKGSK